MSRTTATAVIVVVLGVVGAAPGADAIAPPNDPLYAQQIAPGGALALIHEPQALVTIGATPLADVLVTNLDTGLDLDNPEFAGRLASVPAGTPAPLSFGSPPPPPTTVPAGGSPGWDLIGTLTENANVAPDPDPTDPVGQTSHGTLVAGILGAAFDNGVGGVGVAPNARFLAIRSCWDDDDCFQSIQSDAVDWAAARGVRVFSMSWLATKSDYEMALEPAVAAASNALFVAIPGGNGEGGQPADNDRRPCGDPGANILCVSTSSPEDGQDCGEYNPTIVDLAVPTQNNVTVLNGGGSTPTGCATSFAAPMAAGAAAVLFGLDPTATPAVVKQALIDSARPVAAWAGKSVSGGVLDLDAAVKLFAQRRGIALVADAPPSPPSSPSSPSSPGGRDRTPPRLTSLSLSPSTFAVAAAKGHSARAHRGSTLTLTVSERGSAKVTVARRPTGRRVGGRCVAQTRANRHHAACTRYGAMSVALTFTGLVAGANRRAFSGRVGGHALARGRYRATAVATDAALNRSARRTADFTIVRSSLN